jgi:glycosyltransferase involved in cell wall biosynthesis
MTDATEVGADPIVSVVVPTYNRIERLRRVLRALGDQDLEAASYEVIVVSDGSTDGTDEMLRAGTAPIPIVGITQQNQGPAAARNAGIERARGDVVVFIDDDVVPTRSLLRKHLESHRRLGDRWVVIGPMADPPDHRMVSWVAWEQEMLAKQYAAMDRGEYTATARQFYTGNASIRRSHLVAVGGFDTSFRRAEDVELAYRLDDQGLMFHYEREAIGLHYAERTYEAWCDAATAYGRNDVIFARDLGRGWLFETMAEDRRRRHSALRAVTDACVARTGLRRRVLWVLDRVVEEHPSRPRVRLVRYALSAIYAIRYSEGVVDELGSAEQYRRKLRMSGG